MISYMVLVNFDQGNSSKLSCKMYSLQLNHNIFEKKIFISSVLKNKHIDDQSWAFFFTFNRVKMSPWFYLMWHKFDDIWWSNTDQNITQSGDWLMCYFTICMILCPYNIDIFTLLLWLPPPSLLRPNSTSFPPIMECIELYVSKLIHLRNKF